ncbi:MFS transporter [Dinghuibacter silviterrae]|uniref:FHS family L-fucose permease-like MFS transporter n=1 Tax=Dinghuibacter silviterrae TaxID=1539049 RepID=A0A4R8DUD5_9BACT|nr:MFS transporter [Dinghuibacter silviterrae]TDX01982.1 FHS family L-fucose permease-like MFS transporter [Dinghuibacter silviterrae]
MSSTSSGSKSNFSSFLTLTIVFFFWGFVAASNDILIPVFKDKLHLSPVQSQMISFCFYAAYTVGALIYFFISKAIGGDILNRIGYKNGIALGLVISTLGALLFYPAAETASFAILLSGLFVIGLGYALQQTAANPLAIAMGDPKTGSQRLSLAGGINNFGTTIGPVVVSLAIFGSVTSGNTVASISKVKFPYLIIGALFLLVAVIFKFSKLPNKIQTEDDEKKDDGTRFVHSTERGSVFNYPQLVLGMLAIFIYVGVEVSTASNLPLFLTKDLNIATSNIAPYISLYWASLMIGRWTSSVGAFNIGDGAKKILRFVMPYIAFAVFVLINKAVGRDLGVPFYWYALVIIVMIIGDLLSKGNPARQLLLFASFAICALFIGMLSHGIVSAFAFISVGLFCSTLWPCIFTLAVAGLGKHTSEGSSFLIMMICGGGFIAVLQGYLASDNLLGIQWSYIVGVCCFAYLAFYAVKAKAVLKAQGIDFDKVEVAKGGGH